MSAGSNTASTRDAGVAIDRDTRVGAGSFTQVNGMIGYDLRPGQPGLAADVAQPQAGR